MSLPNRREAIVAYQQGIEELYFEYLPLWPELFQLIVSTLTKPLLGFNHAADIFTQQLYTKPNTNKLLDQWFTLQIAVKTRLALVYEEGIAEMARIYQAVVQHSSSGEACDVTNEDLDDEEFLILLSFRTYLAMVTKAPTDLLNPKEPRGVE